MSGEDWFLLAIACVLIWCLKEFLTDIVDAGKYARQQMAKEAEAEAEQAALAGPKS